jgi:hypothetical protein
MMEATMSPTPSDPYKTQPLPPLTEALARPVRLPLAALLALAVVPAIVIAALLVGAGSTRQSAPKVMPLLPSPTLGLARVAAAAGLPRATVAYDAPGGQVVGALEPGRGYRVVARSGLDWVQLDVAGNGEAPNLVWVAAGAVPETQTVAGLADLATAAPTPTAQVVYVAAAPAAPAAAPPPSPRAAEARAPEPTAAYVLAPPTPAPRSVVMAPYPTATPCSIRDLGLSLQPCHGYVR